MPANLPPDYFVAEQRYREAKTPEGKIEALEEMLAIMPKHKGTDKLRADLRRRLAKHRDQSQKKKGSAKHKTVYSIDREGAAQVVIVGAPNTGKSSLVDRLTNAAPEVADFPHSTHKPMPGMALYENVQFQLVDTPPVTSEYVDPLMADLIRRADIVAVLIDLCADPLEQFEEVMAILEGFRIFPEGSSVPENILKQPVFKKVLVVANKMDGPGEEEDFKIFLELTEMKLPCLGISVKTGRNLGEFLKTLFHIADIIRVYTKMPGKEPDLNEPFIIPRRSTVNELAAKIHKDFVVNLKYAKVWGSTVHDGQMVQRDYVMQDGDIVEIHI